MAACAVGVSGVVKSLGSTGRLRGFLVPWAQEESKIWTGVSLPCPGACGSWVHHRLECSAWFLTLLTETASVSVKSPRGSSIAFHGGWGREALQGHTHEGAFSPRPFVCLLGHGIVQRCDRWSMPSFLESCPGSRHGCASFPVVFSLQSSEVTTVAVYLSSLNIWVGCPWVSWGDQGLRRGVVPYIGFDPGV